MEDKMIGKNDIETIRQARKMAGKARWEAISRTIPPFYYVRPSDFTERPLPMPMSLLKWGIFCLVVAATLLYLIAS
jgi:hypothetical protein